MIVAKGDWVVVIPEKVEDRTEGGLYIPEDKRRIPRKGQVVSVGQDVRLNISNGDTIHFKRYSHEEITIGDDTYYMVQQKDILAKDNL